MAVLFCAQSAHAGLFGWHTTVKATDSINEYTRGIRAPTHYACERARAIAISDFVSLGYRITSAPGCSPLPFRIPEYIDWEKIRWPWPGPGPDCWSCPLLTKDNLTVIYPKNADKVLNLMEKYNIDIYNEQLHGLQQEFDLEGFEAEMHNLEMNQGLGAPQGKF